MRRIFWIFALAWTCAFGNTEAARADTISQFTLQGSFGPGDPLTGTLTIDTTTGTVTGANVTAIYNGTTYTYTSVLAQSYVKIAGLNHEEIDFGSSPELILYIEGSPYFSVPPPLIGYTGSPVCSVASLCTIGSYDEVLSSYISLPSPPSIEPYYDGYVNLLSGSLTPASATPEPSSLLLLATGLLGSMAAARWNSRLTSDDVRQKSRAGSGPCPF